MNRAKIYKEVSKELGIDEKIVKEAYELYWKFIKETIENYPMNEELSEEFFRKEKTSFVVPELGKLYCSYRTWENTRKRFNYIKERRHVKNKED